MTYASVPETPPAEAFAAAALYPAIQASSALVRIVPDNNSCSPSNAFILIKVCIVLSESVYQPVKAELLIVALPVAPRVAITVP